MKNKQAIFGLLSQLYYDCWGQWEDNQEYYLHKLLPQLLIEPEECPENEIGIFMELQNYFSPNNTGELVSAMQDFIQNEQQKKLKNEQKKQHAEEQERRKNEIKKEQERNREQIKNELKKMFIENFLHSDQYYKTNYEKILKRKEYDDLKAEFIQEWIKKNTKTIKPNHEQALAIGAAGANYIVTARAGSGKTLVIVNRALFLIRHCGVPPKKIMLLAFNKKAAEEMKSRLKKHLNNDMPHTMTFHALAYSIVHPENTILTDDETNNSLAKSRELQCTIDEYLRDPIKLNRIRTVMMDYFRLDWENIVKGKYLEDKKDFLYFRRFHQPNISLSGKYVKSHGEKVIADFLFEHDIKYKYEKNFPWNGRNYRPDFTLFEGRNARIIIEYFGMTGDAEYDEMKVEKREFWKKEENKDWQLMELNPDDVYGQRNEAFQIIKDKLVALGVNCQRLSEEVIWERVRDRAIDRFTKTVINFIGRARKQALSPMDLQKKISSHYPETKVEENFLELVQELYADYLMRLEELRNDDFDGLMLKASDYIRSGQTKFIRKSENGELSNMKYICIDEYQDFSKLFLQLIEAIKEKNSDCELFCVGDDWQAINAFAGSDTYYYEHYSDYFSPCDHLNISTNYRSAKSIVEAGNALMAGHGQYALSKDNAKIGSIHVVDLDAFKPDINEQSYHCGDLITPMLLRIIKKRIQDGSRRISILTRKNHIPYYIGDGVKSFESPRKGIDAYLDYLRSFFSKEERAFIDLATVHKYKGLEGNTVILLDAIDTNYPLIHPDWFFTKVFGDTIKKLDIEERRLFYVGITRAKENLFIVTESSRKSPFLKELMKEINIKYIDWNLFPNLSSKGKSGLVSLRVRNEENKENVNKNGGTYYIKEDLKTDGFQWHQNSKIWYKQVSQEDFHDKWWHDLKQSKWSRVANKVTVEAIDADEKTIKKFMINDGVWSEAKNI